MSEVLRRACYDCHSHETVWGLSAADEAVLRSWADALAAQGGDGEGERRRRRGR